MIYSRKHAFTLVELSVVITIIALIIGGIMVGRDLIRTSENRAFISQIGEIEKAVGTFQEKYNCMPGDCANATSFGFSSNGNGNGMVSTIMNWWQPWLGRSTHSSGFQTNRVMYLTNTSSPDGFASEGIPFWNHLTAAGLFYQDLRINSEGVETFTAMVPKAKNHNSGIAVGAWNGKHYLRTGLSFWASDFGAGVGRFNHSLSPSDAAYIFTKMDGGKITLGNTRIGNVIADGMLNEERFIPTYNISTSFNSGYNGNDEVNFYHPVRQGTGGANANFCIDNSVTPPFFNVKNPRTLCGMIIELGF